MSDSTSLTFQKILVPVDFSGYSIKATDYALKIASNSKSEVTLFHTIEPPYDYASILETNIKQIERGIQRKLDQLKKELSARKEFKEITIETAVITGQKRSSIPAFAREENYNLIVMGSRGESPFRKKLFGSISTAVALRSPIPVIIVPEDDKEPDFTNIMYATDYRKGDISALERLSVLAGFFKSSIHVVHISETDDFEPQLKFRGFRNLVNEKLPDSKIHHDIYFDKNLLTGLSRFIEDKSIGLIVLSRYRKSVIRALFETNHTKEMGYYAKTPLLILPSEN